MFSLRYRTCLIVFLVCATGFASTLWLFPKKNLPVKHNVEAIEFLPASSTEPFLYTFNTSEILEESGSIEASASQYFWLNSGAKLIIENGVGSTIIGSLPATDAWHTAYKLSNPKDTTSGAYPQNLFRLLTRNSWENITQEIDFSIHEVHAITSDDRDAYSGVFLMSRYSDANNLYYAGVRMDGKAVIKKKVHGVYFTLAEAQLFTSDTPFDRIRFPNLIPVRTWYRMAVETKTTTANTVQVTLLFAHNTSLRLEVILSTTDTGMYLPPLLGEGHLGVRTDFSDVYFDNYRITEVRASP